MPIDKAEAIKITSELEQLQLEEARERVHQIRTRRTQKELRRKAIQDSLANNNQMDALRHAGCAHKKGGKGIENWFKGNDSDYAVVKHTLSHGPKMVCCQRCGMVWLPPDPFLNRKGATVEERREYKRLWDAYKEALNFPTNNEDSGANLFEIPRRDEVA